MHKPTLQRQKSVFYSLFSPESFTAELHLGLKAQICNQITFKKCGGRAQKSNVKYMKVHFSHEPRKKSKIRFSQKTHWTVCRPL